MCKIEEFKDFNYSNMNYKVGNLGTIIGKRGILKQRLNKDGYLLVTLGDCNKRTTFRVHRIVALLFVPNPNNYEEVNHIDFNRSNPRYDNLEWCTHIDNIHHSSNRGRYKTNMRGESNPKATLTNEQVIKIRNMYDKGFTVREIILEILGKWKDNNEYKSWHSKVIDICKRRTWIHI